MSEKENKTQKILNDRKSLWKLNHVLDKRPSAGVFGTNVIADIKKKSIAKKMSAYEKSRADMPDNEHMMKRRKGFFNKSKGLGN